MPGRWPEEERDAPVTLSRLRCANPDTVEWRLKIGGELAGHPLFCGVDVGRAEALARILAAALPSTERESNV